jgi:hypothetical protein
MSIFYEGKGRTYLTCGVRRVMIVTISNLMNAPSKTSDSDTNDQLAYETRQLQVEPLKVYNANLTFKFFKGSWSGAITLMMISLFALAIFYIVIEL